MLSGFQNVGSIRVSWPWLGWEVGGGGGVEGAGSTVEGLGFRVYNFNIPFLGLLKREAGKASSDFMMLMHMGLMEAWL